MIATFRQSPTDQSLELKSLLETLERDGLIEQIVLEPLTEAGLISNRD